MYVVKYSMVKIGDLASNTFFHVKMDRKLQYKHHLDTEEAKRDQRRVAQNGRKNV